MCVHIFCVLRLWLSFFPGFPLPSPACTLLLFKPARYCMCMNLIKYHYATGTTVWISSITILHVQEVCVHRGYVSFFRCGIYLICDRLLLPSQIACVLYVLRNPPDISRIFRLYLMIFQMTLYHHYSSIVHHDHQQIAKFYVLPRLYIFL